MLELHDVSLSAGESWLLRKVSAAFPPGHLCAVVGPSGGGKSTLLKAIAGIRPPEEGSVRWEGRDLDEHDLAPHEIGYVPQFSIAFDLLTVAESVDAALRLRIGGLSADEREERGARILTDVGLKEIADRRVAFLSGGQKRRLALALEMVSAPVLLLCDEVTSGLDAKAEDEIVRLLHHLARETERTVLSVTHSLRHLHLHDSVALLCEGYLVYHGPPQLLLHYFSVASAEHLFPRLAKRAASDWHISWQKHRASYEQSLGDDEQPVARAEDAPIAVVEKVASVPVAHRAGSDDFRAPSFLSQFVTLLARRWRIFLRDRGQLALQAALLFGFPCLVVIFAWDGLPQVRQFETTGNALQQLVQSASYFMQASRIAGLVSGLVMFQVILLTLMGSNNSAREIAGERQIFEKEKFAGVRATSYIASKTVFLAVLVAAQSIWMAVFVNTICRFPGDLLGQIGILLLVNAAMTAVCLGISSLMKSAEQASLVCVYFVGFQLPLSGAVLALPHLIGWFTRPFIAAYWGWSGYLQTMRDTPFYDVVQSVSQTELSPYLLSGWVLGSHVVAGLLIAWIGARQSRWD